MEALAQSLGRAIRYARRAGDLSQERLAEAAGISYRHLGELERGYKTPSITTLVAVVERGLGSTIPDFWTRYFEPIREGRRPDP